MSALPEYQFENIWGAVVVVLCLVVLVQIYRERKAKAQIAAIYLDLAGGTLLCIVGIAAVIGMAVGK